MAWSSFPYNSLMKINLPQPPTPRPPMMKMTFNLFAILSLFIALVILWVWRIIDWIWIRPKKIEKCLRAQGFKGNSYRLLYGDTKDMAAMIKEAKSKPIKLSDDILPRVLPLHHHIIAKYGKSCFIWIGPVARILIMDPQLIKEILNNNNIFKKPTPNPLAKFLVSGLSGYEDDKWAKHRKIINPAFYVEKLKHMLPAMHMSCAEMINKWEKLTMEGENMEINVQPYLEDLTCEVISRTAFGSGYGDGRKIFELQREQAELTRQVLQSVYIPGWRYIPTKRNRRLKEINNNLSTLLRDIIKQRERTMEMGNSMDDDLLSILLKSNQKEIKENGSSHGMSIDEVIEECKTFYFSGQETTANLLAWTMVMLSIHQTWQERAREEVLQVLGDDVPDLDALNRLKTVTMILHEVLRLYPPAVIFNRIINKETKLGEITLPAGVHLLLPVILLHRDQQLWGKDAEEFKPNRFSHGVAKATNNQLSFFPFSWGPRICIGNNFALMEAKLALATILRRFTFHLSPSYTHAPSYVVTLQPQSGVHLMFTKTN